MGNPNPQDPTEAGPKTAPPTAEKSTISGETIVEGTVTELDSALDDPEKLALEKLQRETLVFHARVTDYKFYNLHPTIKREKQLLKVIKQSIELTNGDLNLAEMNKNAQLLAGSFQKIRQDIGKQGDLSSDRLIDLYCNWWLETTTLARRAEPKPNDITLRVLAQRKALDKLVVLLKEYHFRIGGIVVKAPVAHHLPSEDIRLKAPSFIVTS